ncbi:hypothetical protein F5882DRAFT_135476 [Hyaloscypha sp. PMI_1271]|nr:hypothetical protein F5882DRAFT_135476 [Hyaloscypha sp. PMI_1271]
MRRRYMSIWISSTSLLREEWLMHISRFIIPQWVCSINPIRIQTGRRDCTYNATDNVPHVCTCPTLPNRMEDLRRTQHDAPRIYVCLLWRSSYFLGYASLDGDFAVGGRDGMLGELYVIRDVWSGGRECGNMESLWANWLALGLLSTYLVLFTGDLRERGEDGKE